jgi:hypothetical protein
MLETASISTYERPHISSKCPKIFEDDHCFYDGSILRSHLSRAQWKFLE